MSREYGHLAWGDKATSRRANATPLPVVGLLRSAPMTSAEFAARWDASTRTERTAAHEHFIDLCQMLGVPTPNTDPHGTDHAFEKGAEKTGGGDGWADVWMRGHFAWEYKKKHRDLVAAYAQLLKYREALDNPPLLVVRTWRASRSTPTSPAPRTARTLSPWPTWRSGRRSRCASSVRCSATRTACARTWRGPSSPSRPPPGSRAWRRASARRIVESRGHHSQPAVAHFLDRVLFCLLAGDAGLLPHGLMKRLVENLYANPASFNSGLALLFEGMAREGGSFGTDWIDWFDGSCSTTRPPSTCGPTRSG